MTSGLKNKGKKIAEKISEGGMSPIEDTLEIAAPALKIIDETAGNVMETAHAVASVVGRRADRLKAAPGEINNAFANAQNATKALEMKDMSVAVTMKKLRKLAGDVDKELEEKVKPGTCFERAIGLLEATAAFLTAVLETESVEAGPSNAGEA